MSEVEVRELTENEYSSWNDLVETSHEGTIFDLTDWLTVCSNNLSKKLIIYGCFENDELVGGLSLFSFKYKGFQIYSSTCDMTPYGGIIFKNKETTKVRENEKYKNDIINSIQEKILNKKYDSISLTNSPSFLDIRPFIWNGWGSQVRYTYCFKLDSDIDSTISRNVRRSLKKAQKNNISIETENSVSIFYRLFKMTYDKQNLKPPVSKEFISDLLDVIYSKKLGEMWVAKTEDGDVASAEIITYDNKRAYRWAAASDPSFKNTEATTFLLYSIFCDLFKRGYNEINLMAANTPHLTKFISSFNPTLVPYYSVEKTSLKYSVGKMLYQIVKK